MAARRRKREPKPITRRTVTHEVDVTGYGLFRIYRNYAGNTVEVQNADIGCGEIEFTDAEAIAMAQALLATATDV